MPKRFGPEVIFGPPNQMWDLSTFSLMVRLRLEYFTLEPLRMTSNHAKLREPFRPHKNTAIRGHNATTRLTVGKTGAAISLITDCIGLPIKPGREKVARLRESREYGVHDKPGWYAISKVCFHKCTIRVNLA
ncbi:unnamed protein product [Pleuronectes platessa]|uniref:Uncharacterized protein n=1 Tax=Pleuronectes platessa TaxID=8262 RepID=A0A9N7V831_PLEPL|nr:unnamed protein product [Pleuronectes platessa]